MRQIVIRDRRILVPVEAGDPTKLAAIPGRVWAPSARIFSFPQTNAIIGLVHKASNGVDLYSPKFKAELQRRQKFIEYRRRALIDPIEKLPFPKIRKFDPWEHQIRPYHLARVLPATMLAMDMGTGKTKVAIDVAQNIKIINKICIVCPKHAADVWWDEIAKHCVVPFIRIPLFDGRMDQRVEAGEVVVGNNNDLQFYIVNYDVIWQEPMKKWLLAQNWDLMIGDESHRFKSAGSNVSQAMFKMGQRAKKRIALTGTPWSDSPLHIYGQYRFLDCGIFGTNKARFDEEYAIYGGYHSFQIIGYKNKKRLARKFTRIGISVPASVLDLPPIQNLYYDAPMNSKTRKIYRQMQDDLLVEINEDRAAIASNILVKSIRLQQITSGFLVHQNIDDPTDTKMDWIGHEKADLLGEIAEDIAIDEPLVIFYKFKPDIESIMRSVINRNFYYLSGQDNHVKHWKADKSGGVLIAQIQAGKESIDLTKSRYCILYSDTYSNTDYQQLIKRIHRPGQTRSTFMIHLALKGTVDKVIHRSRIEKTNLSDSIRNHINS